MDSLFGVGSYVATAYVAVMLFLYVVAIGEMFFRYVRTGRVRDERDDFISITDSNERLVFFSRGRGYECFLSGLMIDVVLAMLLFALWPIMLPMGLLTVLAIMLRHKHKQKQEFISNLRGQHNGHDHT